MFNAIKPLELPKEGHYKQVYHMFSYLKTFHNSELVFDPSDPLMDEAKFKKNDWTSRESLDIAQGTKFYPQIFRRHAVLVS